MAHCLEEGGRRAPLLGCLHSGGSLLKQGESLPPDQAEFRVVLHILNSVNLLEPAPDCTRRSQRLLRGEGVDSFQRPAEESHHFGDETLIQGGLPPSDQGFFFFPLLSVPLCDPIRVNRLGLGTADEVLQEQFAGVEVALLGHLRNFLGYSLDGGRGNSVEERLPHRGNLVRKRISASKAVAPGETTPGTATVTKRD